MLIKQPQVEIVNKIVRTASGELVRAYFALVTIEGRVEVKFLGTKAVEADISSPEAVLSLPGAFTAAFGESIVRTFESFLSPFFSHAYLLASQPARAPSLA
jgi:hypothetical protein